MGSKRLFSMLTLALFVSACTTASKPQEAERAGCEQVDWYELGRRDGSQGAPTDRLVAHQKECRKNFNPEWETVYTNGRNAGLVEFCEAKNGFELGRSGVAYFYVCPSTVEPQFLQGYRKGQQARELELQNQKLDGQIELIAQKIIQTESLNEQTELNSQLAELKQSRGKNDQELSKIISK
jgi:hypothetical protein